MRMAAANEEKPSNIVNMDSYEEGRRNKVAQSAASISDGISQPADAKGVHVEGKTADEDAKQVPAQTKEEVTWPNLGAPAARLKWCGCLASSPCSHFTNYYQHYNASHSWNMPSTSFAFPPPHAVHPSGVRLNTSQQYFSSYPADLRQVAKLKAQFLAHPMYDQLLAAHIACLRVATPVDHLQSIDAQVSSNIHHVAAKYSSFLGSDLPQSSEGNDDLDHFMANFIVLLHSFKEQLHEHVRVQAMDAVMSCWEIEKAFISLTGVSPGEGSGATMSDEEEEVGARNFMHNDSSIDFLNGIDSLGLGPLLPSESERSLMERVRLDLKSELKQGYKNRIADVREEILRKRRAGKLPSETTAILKKWWNAHSKWPYPTEDEKARLVQETGLELKQINNWFINQRKRNWHSHATSTSASLPKNESSMSTTDGPSSSISLGLNYAIDKASNLAQDNPQSETNTSKETM